MSDNIQIITKSPEGEQSKQDTFRSGWDGPGWYFWDETQVYCHGPFESREQAVAAMDVYARSL